MALDVEWFEVHASLILLLGSLQQLGDDLIHYVVDRSTTLQCAHVMSERKGILQCMFGSQRTIMRIHEEYYMQGKRKTKKGALTTNTYITQYGSTVYIGIAMVYPH